MHLLVDENLQELTVEFLRTLGHDVRSVQDEGLVSMDDAVIFERACQSERILLTYDVDFVDVRQLRGKHHNGIIRLRVSDQRISHMHPVLENALARIVGADMRDALVTISDRRIRIRKTFFP